MAVTKLKVFIIPCLVAVLGLTACTRNTIEFGEVPENNYTNLSYIDTVGVKLSTVLTDSFPTSGASSYLLGKYKDPYLGTITAKPFFQMDKPTTIPDISSSARYDSIILMIKPNEYYYGDTSLTQTINVSELAQPILASYSTNLYNTSDFPVKPVPLGTKTLRIRPVADDSIMIRLDDTKGLELFTKLQQQSSDITSTESFLNYFKGISLSTSTTDIASVFGLSGGAGSVVMRIYYHTNTPYEELHSVDFPSLSNQLSFNQVLADRSGTGIVSAGNGITELYSSQTGNYSFSQPGTGLYLKLTFPSLKTVLQLGSYVKLLKAELIVRPAYLSFDFNKYLLPDKLSLAATDGSNIIGSTLLDSTNSTTLYASPVIDAIYGENTYYRFNITSYISQLLTTTGGNDNGLFVMQAAGSDGSRATRLVSGTTGHNNFVTQLQLSVLIIK